VKLQLETSTENDLGKEHTK